MVRETLTVMWWANVDTERVSDAGSSTTVLAVSIGLAAAGVALLALTVWFWRFTRPDPDALGPLVVMSDREFARQGPIEQRRLLDVARPTSVAIDAPDEAVPVVDPEAPIESPSEPPIEPNLEAEEPFVEPDIEPDIEPEVEPEVVNEDPASVSSPDSIDPLL